jgi:predicted enzyme related to lactoylglutathione lyase
MTTEAEGRTELGLLDHIQAAAPDVEALAGFYRDVLGATVQSVSSHWAQLRLANVDIGIHLSGDGPRWEPGFRVHDIAAFKRHLLTQGVEVTQDFHDIPGGVTLGFRDPAGHPLAVYQYGVSVEELRRAG